jgi:hypothetical protein
MFISATPSVNWRGGARSCPRSALMMNQETSPIISEGCSVSTRPAPCGPFEPAALLKGGWRAYHMTG